MCVRDVLQVIVRSARSLAGARYAALGVPGPNGIAVLRELRARGAAARVLVLTSGNDPTQVSLALRSGASGFLYKDVDPDALVRAIRAVNDGNMLLAPGAAGSLVPSGGAAGQGGWFPGRPSGWGGLAELTTREREVLDQIARVCPTVRSPACCTCPRRP